MTWVLGLDIGDVRIGAALGQLEGGLATPLGTFLRGAGRAEKALLRVIEEREVLTVVAGLPLNQFGAETVQCLSVRRFCERLKRRAPVEIVYIDEHLTTAEAEELLQSSTAARGRHQKGVLDALAASIILQDYFNRCRCDDKEGDD